MIMLCFSGVHIMNVNWQEEGKSKHEKCQNLFWRVGWHCGFNLMLRILVQAAFVIVWFCSLELIIPYTV